VKKFGLIPARFASSRLHGKALRNIHGLPMVVHVAKRAMLSNLLDEVIVCTDHDEIARVCVKHRIKVCITPNSCLNGTERIFEAAKLLDIHNDDIIIDIQGDEPLVNPVSIDKVIEETIKNLDSFDIVLPHLVSCPRDNKNIVKVISSGQKVIYLTRSDGPFPFTKETDLKKHLSIIGFSFNSLLKFASLEIGELESIEGVELLRAIEGGMKILTFPVRADSFSVDTYEDLEKAERALSQCEIFKKHYLND